MAIISAHFANGLVIFDETRFLPMLHKSITWKTVIDSGIDLKLWQTANLFTKTAQNRIFRRSISSSTSLHFLFYY